MRNRRSHPPSLSYACFETFATVLIFNLLLYWQTHLSPQNLIIAIPSSMTYLNPLYSVSESPKLMSSCCHPFHSPLRPHHSHSQTTPLASCCSAHKFQNICHNLQSSSQCPTILSFGHN